MYSGAVDSDKVHAALEQAGQAPSVHNTQPWRWQLGDAVIHLSPTWRGGCPRPIRTAATCSMSCGAWLHHLRMALAGSDIGVTVDRLPDPSDPELLAVVALRPGADRSDRTLAAEQVAAINVRHSDRRRFGEWPVPDAFLAQLVDCAADQGPCCGWRPNRLTGRRCPSRLSPPRSSTPTRSATRPSFGRGPASAEGAVPDGVLGGGDPGSGSRAGSPARRFAGAGTSSSAQIGSMASMRSSLTGCGNLRGHRHVVGDRLSHLRAGEALSAVLLRATTLGLGSSALSEPLELGRNTRKLVL